MAYIPELEPGEELMTQISVQFSKKSRPFNFAVSSRAVFLPVTKLLAVSDPFYFQKISLDRVNEVAIKKLRPYGFWMAALIMIAVGIITGVNMMEPILNHEPGIKNASGTDEYPVTGWPLGLVVGGILLPFAAKKRFGLRVTMQDKSFGWNPPLVVDKASRERITGILDSIIKAFEACRRTGLKITDERRDLGGQSGAI